MLAGIDILIPKYYQCVLWPSIPLFLSFREGA